MSKLGWRPLWIGPPCLADRPPLLPTPISSLLTGMIERAVTKTSLTTQKSDFAFWQAKPPFMRLAALEEIRREYHQWKYHAEPRLQRVHRIAQR